MVQNTLLSYSYSNKRFEIHIGDINFQPGAVISQESKPVVLYSIKLTRPQK